MPHAPCRSVQFGCGRRRRPMASRISNVACVRYSLYQAASVCVEMAIKCREAALCGALFGRSPHSDRAIILPGGCPTRTSRVMPALARAPCPRPRPTVDGTVAWAWWRLESHSSHSAPSLVIPSPIATGNPANRCRCSETGGAVSAVSARFRFRFRFRYVLHLSLRPSTAIGCGTKQGRTQEEPGQGLRLASGMCLAWP
jgi:hypothetical protein